MADLVETRFALGTIEAHVATRRMNGSQPDRCISIAQAEDFAVRSVSDGRV